MQSNLEKFENHLSELENLRRQYNEDRKRYEKVLRNTESALNKVNADVETCEPHIVTLRPKVQLAIDEARQRRWRERDGIILQETVLHINCTMCLEQIQQKDAYTLRCGHVFPRQWVKRWVVDKTTCPISMQEGN